MSYLLLYPVLLSVAQFMSDKVNIERSRHRQSLASFGAAIAVSYLFLVLLPEAYGRGFSAFSYAPLLFGFAAIHLLEKLIYKKFPGRCSLHRVKTYHDELHAAILLIYHFGIGAVLMSLLSGSLPSGLLFLPPLILFSTIGNWSVHHHYVTQNPLLRLFIASSTTLGALSAIFFGFGARVNQLLISFIAGVLLFVVVREALPREKEGKPWLFALGVVAYSALILVTQ